MKTVGKMILSKIITIILVVLVLGAGFLWFKNGFFGMFNGTTSSQYSFVIKRFEKESQLVVAGADVETTAQHVFENDALKDWPDWTKVVTKIFVGRDVTVNIPVKTEFKLELMGLSESDINITDHVLTFKKPLTIYVDSQQDGTIEIPKSSNGIVDKVVDAWTSGQKAQEFLNERSQEAMYKTSSHILQQKDKQEKVAQFASEALENLINLGSEEDLNVIIEVSDLNFVIQDKK